MHDGIVEDDERFRGKSTIHVFIVNAFRRDERAQSEREEALAVP